VELSIFEAHYEDDEAERVFSEIDADAYITAFSSPELVEPSPNADGENQPPTAEKETSEESSVSACHVHAVNTHHVMILHKDGCDCAVQERSTESSQHSAGNNVPKTSRSNSLASSTHSLSLRIHDEPAANDVSAKAASLLEVQLGWTTSSLDPSFIVAHVSPELLLSDRWDDAACPYAP